MVSLHHRKMIAKIPLTVSVKLMTVNVLFAYLELKLLRFQVERIQVEGLQVEGVPLNSLHVPFDPSIPVLIDELSQIDKLEIVN